MLRVDGEAMSWMWFVSKWHHSQIKVLIANRKALIECLFYLDAEIILHVAAHFELDSLLSYFICTLESVPASSVAFLIFFLSV